MNSFLGKSFLSSFISIQHKIYWHCPWISYIKVCYDMVKLRMVKNFATDPKHFAIFYLRIHYMQGVLLKNTLNMQSMNRTIDY